jgi:urea transport system permease protein
MTASTLSARRLQLEIAALGIVAIILLVVIPWLNAAGHVSNFTVGLWGKYLSYALLAMSVDLLWGYTGLLSLGQALFFALGGYMHGMYLMRMIGSLGEHHKPIPDFLVFLGWTELPSFWQPFQSFAFAMTMVVLVPGFLALAFGYLAFRSRIKGVYFSILTQALTYAASIVFFRNNLLMGGNNGFTDFKFILGHSLVDTKQGPATMRALYIATGVTLLLVYVFRRWLSHTKFGLVQRAIRDSETRVLFSGYAAANYKLFIFVLAAVIASIGGALFVPQAGIINPEEMRPEKSLEAVVWVAVGGRGTLLGPIIGAVGVNALKSWATRAYPDLWLIILGGLFIVIVVLLPKGLAGIPAQLWSAAGKLRKGGSEKDNPRAAGEPAAAADLVGEKDELKQAPQSQR